MEIMDRKMTFGTFFLPGPTEVRQDVLQAMLKPMIPHRSAEFEELFARLQDGLRAVFLTKRPVYIAAASGTGMMEAAIRAIPCGNVRPGGRSLRRAMGLSAFTRQARKLSRKEKLPGNHRLSFRDVHRCVERCS
jgi:aspartate aminotransferase-like enzyme